MNIGLLMINSENDILARTLHANAEFVDRFYVLDGTVPNDESQAICLSHPKCAGYITDAETGYNGPPRDGWRQAILEAAIRDHGPDNWFLLLHGDEVWTGLPDLDGTEDGFMFRLPLHFPRAGEAWDYTVHPLDQLRWHLAPGYPELRMFKGTKDTAFAVDQHANVVPNTVSRIGRCDSPIRHYLYRSPEAQQERAARHVTSGFDPDNYRHITDGDAVYWTDEMIATYQLQPHWQQLSREGALV